MLTSAFVSFVTCLDACLDEVGVRPPLDGVTSVIGPLPLHEIRKPEHTENQLKLVITHTHTYIYIYIYIYTHLESISFRK
jgi:hypothetical protein